MTSYLPRSYNWAQQPIREVQAGRTTHHPGSFTLIGEDHRHVPEVVTRGLIVHARSSSSSA
jgi:hypothetical protein